MHWLDSTILALLAVSAALGMWSGLLCQVARLASLTIALMAAVLLNEQVAFWLQENVVRQGDSRLCGALAYALVFLGVYLVLSVTTRTLYQAVHSSELELLDRMLGAALAVGKASLVLGMVCLGLSRAEHAAPKSWFAESRLAPILAQSMQTVIGCLPDEARQRIHLGLERVGARQAEAYGEMLQSVMPR
jgi:membrane protein required for colicin V production